MKNLNLIFLLIGFFCFANGQNVDSLQIKLNELEQKNQKIESLIKKVEVAEKKHESAFYRLKVFLQSLIKDKAANKVKNSNLMNREAIKVENPTDPVNEDDLPSGIDTIRGGWLYRLFHKDHFYLKKYKTIDNEKIYYD